MVFLIDDVWVVDGNLVNVVLVVEGIDDGIYIVVIVMFVEYGLLGVL